MEKSLYNKKDLARFVFHLDSVMLTKEDIQFFSRQLRELGSTIQPFWGSTYGITHLITRLARNNKKANQKLLQAKTWGIRCWSAQGK